MSIAIKNQERLAGIIAEIVTALGIDVGDCNLGPGPDICALGDEAVAALKSRMGGTPSGRAEELITQLEAEIVKRDARIVELVAGADRLRTDYDEACQDAMFAAQDLDVARNELVAARDMITELEHKNCLLALKSQPSGVVLPERDGSDAQISFWAGYEFAACGLHNSNIRAAWNDFKGSEQFKRLNPCRAQAVPDGKVAVTGEALRAVLNALVNAPHQIRELQATREPAALFADNPINVLIAEYESAHAAPSAKKGCTKTGCFPYCDCGGIDDAPSAQHKESE